MPKNKTKAEPNKLKNAINKLKHAITFEDRIHDDDFYFDGIAKSFEMCLEYAWKHFKLIATQHGLEVYSPREAIKAAGQLNLIEDVEKWLGFLEDRNYAVHDYLGLSDNDYLETIKEFFSEVNKLKA